jgi:hypothetical protein
MNYILSLALTLVLTTKSYSQKLIENYIPQKDSLRIGYDKDDFFPYDDKGFSLFLPDGEIKGTVISLEDSKINLADSSSGAVLRIEATENGFAYLHISTGIPVDLFFTEKSTKFCDSLLTKVFKENNLPEKNIFLLGVMTSGHRALKYVEYAKKKNSKFNSLIKGVVLCESALDWVRQWYEGQKQVRDHLTDVGFFEGNMVNYLFKQNLKCTPVTCMEKYVEFSPYSYFDRTMRRIQPYKNLAVMAYTFADTEYWFSTQGKGVYDSNYPDMSGIINELKLAGNKNAELKVFQKENTSGQHTKQSSTWKMVGKKELMEWIIKNSSL